MRFHCDQHPEPSFQRQCLGHDAMSEPSDQPSKLRHKCSGIFCNPLTHARAHVHQLITASPTRGFERAAKTVTSPDDLSTCRQVRGVNKGAMTFKSCWTSEELNLTRPGFAPIVRSRHEPLLSCMLARMSFVFVRRVVHKAH